MTEDSMHRTLDAALARNSGPSAEDVGALADQLARWERGEDGANETDHWTYRLARAVLASDWLAAHTAAAEARGAERGARAVVEAVEAAYALASDATPRKDRPFWAYTILAAAREAAAHEGGA